MNNNSTNLSNLIKHLFFLPISSVSNVPHDHGGAHGVPILARLSQGIQDTFVLNSKEATKMLKRMKSHVFKGEEQDRIKDAIKFVPEFDGKVLPLTPFVDGCDEALGIVGENNEANWVKLLRAKVTGGARKFLSLTCE